MVRDILKENEMLKTFDEIIEVTLHHEGGYVHESW